MTTQPFVFTLSRTFDASVDQVWDAWTSEDNLQKWFSPKGIRTFYSKLDLRPGGFYHYGLENPDGSRYYGRWMIREVNPKSRLVFIVSFSNDQMEITHHPLAPTWPAEIHSTIEITPVGDRTKVEVLWKAHDATQEETATFEAGKESMNGGWGGTFDQLTTYLEELVSTS